tara:strand:+ start:58 stop:234 length:177 start_codon:yes stop_codon:yes gene_type:complete
MARLEDLLACDVNLSEEAQMEKHWCKLQVQHDHLRGERSAMLKAAGGAARAGTGLGFQ